MAFKLYWQGSYPRPRKIFYNGSFETRQQIRNWVRNRHWLRGVVIVHPDGKEEPYLKQPE